MSGLRALLTPVTLASRRIRSDVPLTAAVFGVVLVTSFVFAAAPRAFQANAGHQGVEDDQDEGRSR